MEPSPPRLKYRSGEPLPPPPPGYESVLTDYEVERRPKPPGARKEAKDRYWLHALLFAVTVVTTTYAGGTLVGRALVYEQAGAWALVFDGLLYAVPLLLFLSVHEFGHYLTARRHGIDVSLPYYLPIPLVGVPIFNLGTFGAVIRIREPIRRTRQLFDIGVAGPLAGAVVAFGVLLWALWTLPPPEYLLTQAGHDALKAYILQTGGFPEVPPPDPTGLGRLTIGQTPLFWALAQFFPHVPPMYEMYHYPVLFAGWLGLFFTALNLLPVGQLDGGHVVYALLGPRWHGRIARATVLLLLFSASVGLVMDLTPVLREAAVAYGYYQWVGLAGAGAWLIVAALLYFFIRKLFDDRQARTAALFGVIAASALALRVEAVAATVGYSGWFFWCLLIVLLIKVDHPPVTVTEPLTPRRKLLGVLALVLFVLCFSIKPVYLA